MSTTTSLWTSDNNESDVLVVGAGPCGLYAALLLVRMGFSVQIIDQGFASGSTNPAVLWTPRSLQLFHALDLVKKLTRQGIVHRHVEIYPATSKASKSGDVNSFPLWDNRYTEFSWSLACECKVVCDEMRLLLEQHGVQIHYGHTLIDTDVIPQFDHTWAVSSIQTDNGFEYCWKSRCVIGADGCQSFVRQKLGIVPKRQSSSRVFYTLVAKINTNFPGAKSVATKNHDQGSILMIGQRDKVTIQLEHKPSWSRLTIDDPLPLSTAKRYIRRVLEPYNIEFQKIHHYYSWQADDGYCEEFNVDNLYFLVGGAALHMTPPGLLSTNLGLEQTHNLCWKLALHLRKVASDVLLGTVEIELSAKFFDYSTVARAFYKMISHPVYDEDTLESRTVKDEIEYVLTRCSKCFIGETPYADIDWKASRPNISTFSDEHVLRHQASHTPGAIGCIAPNTRLKPYTVLRILQSLDLQYQPSSKGDHTSDDEESCSSPHGSVPLVTTEATLLSDTNSRRSRSSTLRSVTPPPSPSVYSQRSNRLFSQARKAFRQLSLRRKSPPSLASPGPERWRSIRPTHFRLLDRITHHGSPSAFAVLVFLGPMMDQLRLSTTQALLDHITRSEVFSRLHSSIRTNENEPFDPWLLARPRNRLSTSSDFVREALSSAIFSPTSKNASHVAVRSPCPFFSFLFITSSTRADIGQFLSTVPSPAVHGAFPFGLDCIYIDHDQQCYSAYGVSSTDPSIVIIRPDGYIGTKLSVPDQFSLLDSFLDTMLN